MQFVTEDENTLAIYHLRLPTVLNEEQMNIEMFYSVLDHVNMSSDAKNTVLNIYCSGNGGYTDYATQLINALTYSQNNNKADITMIVNGPCLSNHAMIVLAGDKIEIQNYGIYFMFHKGSGGFSNEDPVMKVMEYRKYLLELSHKTDEELGLYDILSRKERAKYEKGEDVLILGEDMRKRLKKLGKEVW